jgi:hypothetical protein
MMTTNEYGTFEVEMTGRGYSVHTYSVTKVSGEWPDKRTVAAMCDDRSLDYFGYEVNLGDARANVSIYVD